MKTGDLVEILPSNLVKPEYHEKIVEVTQVFENTVGVQFIGTNQMILLPKNSVKPSDIQLEDE